MDDGAAIIGPVVKRLVERPGKTTGRSSVENRWLLKQVILLRVVLLGWCRVEITLVGALHKGQRIERHRSASEAHPVFHFFFAPSEQDADA